MSNKVPTAGILVFTVFTTYQYVLNPTKKFNRQDVQNKLKQEKQDLASMRRRCRATKKVNLEQEKELKAKDKQIQSQLFLMDNLKNGINYLKQHCSKTENTSTVYGCTWSDWTDWTECSQTCGAGGTRQRIREKLPGLGCSKPTDSFWGKFKTCIFSFAGSCDGPSEEVSVCNEGLVCPLDNDDNSLVVVIGGETVASRENEESVNKTFQKIVVI